MENLPSCSKQIREMSEQKKKKNRRKQRAKKDNLKEPLVVPNFHQPAKHKPQKLDKKPNFTIEPVRIQPGIVYRKRNPNSSFINLGTFGQSSKTRVIQTDPNELAEQVNKLSVNTEKRTNGRRKPKSQFAPHVSMAEVIEGLDSGKFMKGIIRINPKKSTECYVGNEDRSKADYTINSIIDRNRAMEGDEVLIELKNGQNKEKENNARMVQVVGILREIHPRTAVGRLAPMNKEYALLTPSDKRVPQIRIPNVNWPNNFQQNAKQYEKILFVVKLIDWQDPFYADGIIIENLGLLGDLQVETQAILREFTLDTTPYTENDLQELNLREKAKISTEMIQNRLDLRRDCIFTIDPQTARDLDDAVSCRLLDNGNFLVGVHISDVSHYLSENFTINKLVEKKATTIYLTDNVYHMLPLELCLLCSLLPDKDKLAFSIFWEMTANGDIVSNTIQRTVIRSCAQLAYEQAQFMIENAGNDEEPGNLPKIHNGYTYDNLKSVVNNLQTLAVKLREKRVQNGALRIDQIKIAFSLNGETNKPLEFHVHEIKEAHRLIEEFMLLANITVAEWLYAKCEDLAFLRCHEVPKQSMLDEVKQNMETVGIFLDISTSGGLSASLQKYLTDDFLGQCRWAVLNHLLAKPMVRARYFCTGSQMENASFHHYALSVPLYTHFTSPIRRYADIIVHRLLAATLGYREMPKYTAEKLSQIAENCNRQKYNAKRAGEASSDLFLAYFVDDHKPFIENGVVVDVRDRSFDVIVMKTGSVVRLYTKNFDSCIKWKAEHIKKDNANDDGKKMWKIIVEFPKTNKENQCLIVLEIFSVVKVELFRKKDTNKLDAKLLRHDFVV